MTQMNVRVVHVSDIQTMRSSQVQNPTQTLHKIINKQLLITLSFVIKQMTSSPAGKRREDDVIRDGKIPVRLVVKNPPPALMVLDCSLD